ARQGEGARRFDRRQDAPRQEPRRAQAERRRHRRPARPAPYSRPVQALQAAAQAAREPRQDAALEPRQPTRQGVRMNDGPAHPRYSISVAAELAGMHPQTLRLYDAKGLVVPRRTPGGTRRYSDTDVARLRKIGHLTGDMGMTLSGANHVL